MDTNDSKSIVCSSGRIFYAAPFAGHANVVGERMVLTERL